MKLVVDANVLFSALIKDSTSAELLFNENLDLYFPDFIMDEFRKYESIILKKTHRTREQFYGVLNDLNKVIATVQKRDFGRKLAEAKRFCPDKDDVMYFALALEMECALWSNDKKLKCQDRVKIYSTDELRLILA